MLLTKDEILESEDLKTEDVPVPEWGGTVRVRTMTGADRDAFEDSLITIGADGIRRPNLAHMRTKLVALTLVDENGSLMFSPADVERLALKSAAALNRVYEAAQRLNVIGPAAEAEAAKNSEPAQSGSSTSV